MPNTPVNGYQPDTKSSSARRADFDLLRRVNRLIAEGGGGGGPGVNEVTISATAPTDTTELWVDGTPMIQAKINGVWTPVSGPPGPQGPATDEVWIGPTSPTNPAIELWYDTDAPATGGGAVSYIHTQGAPAASWVVDHNLGWYPNVLVEDSGGTTVEGDIVYNSVNKLTLTFSAAFAGVAYVS